MGEWGAIFPLPIRKPKRSKLVSFTNAESAKDTIEH
jgi:hypothetical protein